MFFFPCSPHNISERSSFSSSRETDHCPLYLLIIFLLGVMCSVINRWMRFCWVFWVCGLSLALWLNFKKKKLMWAQLHDSMRMWVQISVSVKLHKIPYMWAMARRMHLISPSPDCGDPKIVGWGFDVEEVELANACLAPCFGLLDHWPSCPSYVAGRTQNLQF